MRRRGRRGRGRLPRPARAALAVLCAGGALLSLGENRDVPAQPPDGQGGSAGAPASDSPLVREGRGLYVESCSSCHGLDARGVRGVAPSLRGAGAASADFYVRTGRMPMADPEDEPIRTKSPFSERQIRALVAYVGSFGGPPIPVVHPERGKLSDGQRLFADTCAGCHQILGKGGITPRAAAPSLKDAKAVDVGEAIEVGPYVMPRFRSLSRDEVDSLARYVAYARHPEDRGGWGIGHLGPIPEGMIAWLLAGTALLLVIRLLAERTGE